MFTRIITVVVFSLCISTTYSQHLNIAKLDSLFQTLELSNKFMGGVAISKNGEIVYTKNTGYSDIETSRKSQINTKYRIGSITKTFTAILILKAIDEKKLKLDQTIEKYFPLVTNADKITIRTLLNQRSGIHNFTKDEDYEKYKFKGKTEDEMIAIISNAGSDFEPDSKAAYSNSNYVLLSYILERIYKEPYAEILNKKIVRPLGLRDTYFGGKIEIEHNETNSYEFDNDWIKQPETNLLMFTGAGAIVSTPTDVLKFAEAVFNGKVLSSSSLKAMKEIKDDYGLGIGEFSFEGKLSYGHTGHIDGFNSMYGYFVKEKISFAITSNGTGINNNAIAVGLLSIVFNIPYKISLTFN
ncbi:serine hydrolase domain-containing protein [Adhaeribacter aquaticus]|uniref:serine hydrolase domain-containing protein n=1 Tax=Adhaeribacter aquaticus TaxID=299567 RepID=UPI0003F77E27|nr:serine hydrolase domain-containing protein [Adhaeribacter aquaticus]